MSVIQSLRVESAMSQVRDDLVALTPLAVSSDEKLETVEVWTGGTEASSLPPSDFGSGLTCFQTPL